MPCLGDPDYQVVLHLILYLYRKISTLILVSPQPCPDGRIGLSCGYRGPIACVLYLILSMFKIYLDGLKLSAKL
jgi:hypothetical protein